MALPCNTNKYEKKNKTNNKLTNNKLWNVYL